MWYEASSPPSTVYACPEDVTCFFSFIHDPWPFLLNKVQQRANSTDKKYNEFKGTRPLAYVNLISKIWNWKRQNLARLFN